MAESTEPHPLEHVGTDVVDHILEQVEAVPLPQATDHRQQQQRQSSEKATTKPDPSPKGSPLSEIPPPLSPSKSTDNFVESPTTGRGTNSTWKSLASMSSNQLPPAAINDAGSKREYEHEHDRRSVLQDILPGFKSRMADIHHATLKSVTEGSGAASSNANQHSGHQMSDGKPRRLSKSSILYESADPTEWAKSSSDGDSAYKNHQVHHHGGAPSNTHVQGGQGGRHWCHELSPEKAGLVGSVVEVAGLLKDVVLDKIQQRPPSTSASTPASSTMTPTTSQEGTHRRVHLGLSPEEKMEAAKAAFGGSEEAGDQTVYLEGLDEHLRHEKAARSAANAAASPSTTALEAKDLLGSAQDVAQEHHKSIFHLAANPEVRKSMLLEHPELLGYHARDPNLAPFEESVLPTAQHRPAASQVRQQDTSKTSR
ncbi:hypothetical protein BGX31_005181 [Mortierella sp. GBA43]|nr:hypothetical protein BGX31_005181 [Mortierella sp. GBA43]